MIDKIHFGKRIAHYRKNAGLSQVELSDKLKVTSQAISKWECGIALPDVEMLLELSRFYGVSINEMLEGNNLIGKIVNRHYVMKDIAYFIPETERDYNVSWADNMVDDQWISRNWNEQKRKLSNNQSGILNDIAKKINNHGGIIVEIGTGPGGGFMPAILLNNPDAKIIVSDLSPTVVREWKKLLDHELNSPNIYYAALDNCDLPFKEDSVDVVSDGGGIGNTEGDKDKALCGVYRILKPGGLFVTSTGFVTKETLNSLPLQVQKILLDKRPDIFEDLYEETITAGFKKIDSIIVGGWYTDDDQSTIADLARSLGVNLKFTSYVRYCVK